MTAENSMPRNSRLTDLPQESDPVTTVALNRRCSLDELRALATRMASETDPTGIIYFIGDESGPDAFFKITFPRGITLDSAREALAAVGLTAPVFDDGAGVTALIFDRGRKLSDPLFLLIELVPGLDIEGVRVRGEFLVPPAG